MRWTNAAKAAITHAPIDQAAADSAMKEYLDHNEKQKAADKLP